MEELREPGTPLLRRENHGVDVILIKRASKVGENGTIISPVDYRIEHGDVLLLAGKRRDVKRLLV